MKIPLSAKVAMGACVGLYLTGYNLISSEEQPDLAGALFMALIVLLADRMRTYMRVFNRFSMLSIGLAYYVISQLAMFCAWIPFWREAESVVEWLCQSEFGLKVYSGYPRAVGFTRRHSVAICKLLLMLFASYGQLVPGGLSLRAGPRRYRKRVAQGRRSSRATQKRSRHRTH